VWTTTADCTLLAQIPWGAKNKLDPLEKRRLDGRRYRPCGAMVFGPPEYVCLLFAPLIAVPGTI
jgi:hypothetical protein